MSLSCKILNGICQLLYQKEYKRFCSPCNVKKVQMDYLKRLLKRNENTIYGEKYDFKNIKSYEDFVKNVPLTIYEDYEPYIEAAACGKKRVLTKEKVTLFELTSGSSGGKKLIPYTRSLKQEFQRGIKPWLCNIYTHVAGVREGKSYWSITPVTEGKQFSQSGIPIGFEEDAQYFGFLEKGIMQRIFAVDGSVKFAGDMQDFYLATCRQLLACEELTLISVWNPTFLTILCEFICEHIDLLLEALPSKRQSYILEAVKEKQFEKIFPHLKIISCWADGSAADYVGGIREYFPTVLIQPKGLLATEGFISFPFVGEEGSRLSIYSHFFEFRRLGDGKIVTADRLLPGEYEIILTTGGGFYRYCIGDIVKVLEASSNHPPRIQFLRRKGVTSDLFGEKLTEEFVREVCKKLQINESFCLLAPEEKHYILYTTAQHISRESLDDALRESFHYNYCRQLGQLEMAEVMLVGGNPEEAYIKRLAAEGMRIGDIKPAYLSKKSNWKNYFEIMERKE